jgi:glyoxylase-like metal-dependent hydrolase (beta-lactamase superfamily II)
MNHTAADVLVPCQVVYVHHPSGVLFVTDLFWNYPGREVPPSTFLWKQGMDKVYLPFYKAFMLKRKDKFDERLRTVLNWDFKIILPCHGNVVSENAHNVLRDHFQ